MWGSDGYEDARRWPLLPLGTMTAGDQIPELDGRQLWLSIFCRMKEPAFDPEQWREAYRLLEELIIDDPLLREIAFLLDLKEKPEEEWSRYEKRRVRKLVEWISRLQDR